MAIVGALITNHILFLYPSAKAHSFTSRSIKPVGIQSSWSSSCEKAALVTSRLSIVRAESMATEKLGIKIEKNPPESKLNQLGVKSWPKWGCPPSKFPWTYDAKETCYLLEGKVKVTPSGSNESVEFGAGDLVEFPKGMSCTWDVAVAVDKHYKFE